MRAFIAIEVPHSIREKIKKIQDELPGEGLKHVEEENLHITLKFLGEIDESKAREIKNIIGSIKFSPFEVNCMGVGVFPNEKYIRVVWVGVESNGILEKLAEELNDKLEKIGFLTAKEKFTSHLTIARVKRKVDLHTFIPKHKNDFFGQFTVMEGDIKLKKSTLTPKGPIYEDL